MDFVTVRELRDESGKIWERVAAGEEIVLTRNGKPFAVVVPTEPAALEDTMRAVRLQRLGRAVAALQTQAQASGAARMTDAEINAEIAAARKAPRVRAPRRR